MTGLFDLETGDAVVVVKEDDLSICIGMVRNIVPGVSVEVGTDKEPIFFPNDDYELYALVRQ
jgi:hypothetical protein